MNDLEDANDNIRFLHQMCHKEYTRFVKFQPQLESLIADYAGFRIQQPLATPKASNCGSAEDTDDDGDSSSSSYLTQLVAYDRNVGILTKLAALFRKLNILVISKTQTTDNTIWLDDLDDEIAADGKNNADDVELKQWQLVQQLFDPKYLEEKYQLGFTGDAIVTHMKAASAPDGTNASVRSQPSQIVWLSDKLNADVQVLYGLNPAICQPLTSNPMLPPPFGMVFGVLLDNILFRAVRYSKTSPPNGDIAESPPNDRYTVLLIDTGESIDISLTNEKDAQQKLFVLPEQHAEIAPQAVACRVSINGSKTSRGGDTAAGRSELLQLQACDKIAFEVVQPTDPNDFIHVSLSLPSTDTPPPLTIAPAEPPPPTSIGRPPSASTNPFLQDTTHTQPKPAAAIRQCDTAATNPSTHHDPIIGPSTSNAMVAVTGYNPRDDARLCPHYDRRTGGCFKGARCRLEHSAKLADGWTRDQRLQFGGSTVAGRQLAPQPWPDVGSVIRCVPTHIMHVDHFYGHIVNLNQRPFEPQLSELTGRMNTPEARCQMCPLRRPPCELDLLLAKYSDGCWYRARVLRVNGDGCGGSAAVQLLDFEFECEVCVFFVDYGNCCTVTRDGMRQWDERYGYLPFQAYEFRLAGVVRLPTSGAAASIASMRLDDDADVALASLLPSPRMATSVSALLLYQEMRATVRSNFGTLVVTMADSEDRDVGATLAEMGLVQLSDAAWTSTSSTLAKHLCFPG